jgi:hypothetical protein
MKKESVLLGSWKVKENESGEGNKRQKWMGEYSQSTLYECMEMSEWNFLICT